MSCTQMQLPDAATGSVELVHFCFVLSDLQFQLPDHTQTPELLMADIIWFV